MGEVEKKLTDLIYEVASVIRDDVYKAHEEGDEKALKRIFLETTALNSLSNSFKTMWNAETTE